MAKHIPGTHPSSHIPALCTECGQETPWDDERECPGRTAPVQDGWQAMYLRTLGERNNARTALLVVPLLETDIAALQAQVQELRAQIKASGLSACPFCKSFGKCGHCWGCGVERGVLCKCPPAPQVLLQPHEGAVNGCKAPWNEHEECEACKLYVCPTCREVTHWSDGGSDTRDCDACWVTKGGAAQHDADEELELDAVFPRVNATTVLAAPDFGETQRVRMVRPGEEGMTPCAHPDRALFAQRLQDLRDLGAGATANDILGACATVGDLFGAVLVAKTRLAGAKLRAERGETGISKNWQAIHAILTDLWDEIEEPGKPSYLDGDSEDR